MGNRISVKGLLKENNINFLLSLIIALLYMLLVCSTTDIVYIINDDRGMSYIASGAMSGNPDGHVIFMNYTFSWMLSRLYICLPGYDWYGITMLGIMTCGLIAVLYRFCCLSKKMLEKYCGVCLCYFSGQLLS